MIYYILYNRSLKEQRKKQQQDNVEKKKDRKEEIKQKCLAGMKKADADNDSDVETPESKGLPSHSHSLHFPLFFFKFN